MALSPFLGPWLFDCRYLSPVARSLAPGLLYWRSAIGHPVRRPDPEVVEWIERLCAEQGVEVKITDTAAVERVAALLQEGRHPHRTAPETVPSE